MEKVVGSKSRKKPNRVRVSVDRRVRYLTGKELTILLSSFCNTEMMNNYYEARVRELRRDVDSLTKGMARYETPEFTKALKVENMRLKEKILKLESGKEV